LNVERKTTDLILEKAAELRAKREAANAIDESEEDKLLSFIPKDSLPQENIQDVIAEDELTIQEAE